MLVNDPWKTTALHSASSSHNANIKISPKIIQGRNWKGFVNSLKSHSCTSRFCVIAPCNDNLQVLVGTLPLEPLWLHRSRDATWLFLTGWGSENPMAADLCNSTDISLTAACSILSEIQYIWDHFCQKLKNFCLGIQEGTAISSVTAHTLFS